MSLPCPQRKSAAADFREYLARSPNGVRYDTRAKAYVATSKFEPVFGEPNARAELERFLVDGDPLVAELTRLERPIDPSSDGPSGALRAIARSLGSSISLLRSQIRHGAGLHHRT